MPVAELPQSPVRNLESEASKDATGHVNLQVQDQNAIGEHKPCDVIVGFSSRNDVV